MKKEASRNLDGRIRWVVVLVFAVFVTGLRAVPF